MKITLHELGVDPADEIPQPVVIEAGTAEALEVRLFDYLASGEAQQVVQFAGDYDFCNSQRFMQWLAARPVVDVQGDEEFLELFFGTGSYSEQDWSPPDEPYIIIDPAVGTDTGHRIGIDGGAYALVRRPGGSYLLFTSQSGRVIVREHWDNGWGHTTRELAVREDGLLEASCRFSEGMASTYGLLPAAEGDEQIAEAVIHFNRSSEDGFFTDLVEEKTFHELLDRYLLGDDTVPDVGIYVTADYKLTAKQRAAARERIQLERR